MENIPSGDPQAPAGPASPLQKVTARIETVDDALKVIRDSARFFYALAFVEGLISFFLIGVAGILSGLLLAGLGFLVGRFKNRVAAVILLVFALLGALSTIRNLSFGALGGLNILVTVLFTLVSVRAVQATFRLNTLRRG